MRLDSIGGTIRLVAKRILTILNDSNIIASVREFKKAHRNANLLPTGYRRFSRIPFLAQDIFFYIFRDQCVLCSGVEIAHVSVYRVTSTRPTIQSSSYKNYIYYYHKRYHNLRYIITKLNKCMYRQIFLIEKQVLMMKQSL